ncbi:tail fiber protein [Dysgonomonas capnocytophagoides]|uniref:tail fiber protein n=1 Tax=Dysgonomonas capnocytophagoides TaxID=45254 RepID=UPI00334095DD
MDKINFLAQDSFPVSTDTLNRLQNSTSMVAALALLGGSNYILSGCQEKDGKIEPGMIVFNGEILPFLGGTPLEFIEVQETKTELEAFDDLYPEAYIDRIALFAELGKYKWESMKRVVTNLELDNKIASLRGEPLSTKLDYTGRVDRIPENYMLADGRLLKTAEYPELAWFYGAENLESFSLPDLRHMFIAGYDPTLQDYSEVGKTGGEEKHALTADENGEHQHIVPWGENLNTAWRPDWGYPDDKFNNSRGYKAETDNDNTWPYTSPSGKGEPHENRPQFYVLAYIIKVKY